MAPSVWQNENETRAYGYEADWWAFAATISEIAGSPPYTGTLRDIKDKALKNSMLKEKVLSGSSLWSDGCMDQLEFATLKALLMKVLKPVNYKSLETDEARKDMVQQACKHPILQDRFCLGLTHLKIVMQLTSGGTRFAHVIILKKHVDQTLQLYPDLFVEDAKQTSRLNIAATSRKLERRVSAQKVLQHALHVKTQGIPTDIVLVQPYLGSCSVGASQVSVTSEASVSKRIPT